MIDEVLSGYLSALFFMDGSEPEDRFYGCDSEEQSTQFTDALSSHIRQFIDDNKDDVATYLRSYSASRLGHDLYATEYGHGVGFWDLDLGEVGEHLTKYCEVINFSSGLDVTDQGTLTHYSI